MKFGFDWPSSFREDDGRMTEGGEPDNGYTISSTYEPSGSCELKPITALCPP